MSDAVRVQAPTLSPWMYALLAGLAIAGGAAFVIGGREHAAPPTSGSVLVWSGADGAHYYVDTGTVHLVGSGAARQGSATAYYVPPLEIDTRGIALRFALRARMRVDHLSVDCAHDALGGAAVWQERGILAGRVPASVESVFAGAGARTGPRFAALRYTCESPAGGTAQGSALR